MLISAYRSADTTNTSTPPDTLIERSISPCPSTLGSDVLNSLMTRFSPVELTATPVLNVPLTSAVMVIDCDNDKDILIAPTPKTRISPSGISMSLDNFILPL